MIAKRRRSVIYPFVIGLFISAVVVFICVNTIPKYFIEITNESILKNDVEYYSSDIDNSGVSEIIQYYHYESVFQPTLYIYNDLDSIIGLWNFFDKPLKQRSVYFGDYNNDSIKEIYLFTNHSDSLFLHIIDERFRDYKVDRKFICKLDQKDNFKVQFVGFFDLHNSEKKEFLFVVKDEYNKLYSLNIENEILSVSPEFSVDITNPILVKDYNNDGYAEIYLSSKSNADNQKAKQSEFIALNHDLEYLFEPVVFTGSATKTTIGEINFKLKKHLIVVNTSIDSVINYSNVMLYDFDGNKLQEKVLENSSNIELIQNIKGVLLLFDGNNLFEIKSDLKENLLLKLNGHSKYKFEFYDDINGDYTKELIFSTESGMVVVDDNLKIRTRIDLGVKGTMNYSIQSSLNNEKKLMIQKGNKLMLLSYWKNESFVSSYLFHIFIFIAISLLVWLVFYVKDNKEWFKKILLKDDEERLYRELEKNIAEPLLNKEENFAQTIENKVNKDVNLFNENETSFSDRIFEGELIKLLTDHEISSSRISIYPKGEWKDFKPKLKNRLLEIVSLQMNDLDEFLSQAKDFKIQFLKHNNYINILIEIEGVLIVKNLLSKNTSLQSLVNKVGGKIEVAHLSNIGTLVNTVIPLNEIPKNTADEGKVRVIIAEDHDVSLFGLTSLFKTKDDIDVVGTAKNGMEVMKLLKTESVDIVITDISMPGMDGIELSEQIKNQYPTIKVIVFTMYLENWFVEQLVNNEVKGFVSKNSKITELVSAVRNVNQGNNYYCPQFKSKFGFKVKNSTDKLDSLSTNELEIMKSYANGLNKQEISEKLTVSVEVMDSLIANILLKLKASDEEEIIRIAKKQKYISE